MILILMGVSGSGKTVIGEGLAARLGAGFIEGDDFHPPANIAKMSRGEPLDDADRKPWLDILAAKLAASRRAGQDVVLACSALRRLYRDTLRAAAPDLVFIFLDGSRALIAARLAARRDHFMPPALLESQFAALEAPGPDEPIIRVDIAASPEAIVDAVLRDLAARGSTPHPGGEAR